MLFNGQGYATNPRHLLLSSLVLSPLLPGPAGGPQACCIAAYCTCHVSRELPQCEATIPADLSL